MLITSVSRGLACFLIPLSVKYHVINNTIGITVNGCLDNNLQLCLPHQDSQVFCCQEGNVYKINRIDRYKHNMYLCRLLFVISAADHDASLFTFPDIVSLRVRHNS